VKRRFRIGRPFRVPDGTLVANFFNLGGDMSVAAGIIAPRTSSRIHVMPFVSQLIFVRRGRLVVRMRGRRDRRPYSVKLEAGQAAFTERGTLLQLENDGTSACHVLYLVTPAYSFAVGKRRVIYDDAVLAPDWSYELSTAHLRALRAERRRLRA
jgi:hypothetical protein